MGHVIPIFSREFRSYLKSPIAAITLIVFLLISGWFFVISLFSTKIADMRFFLSSVETIVLIFFSSAVSMRLISEEYRSGSPELIVTMPVKDIEILLGKFLAALALLFLAILCAIPYVMTIAYLGDLDGGQTFSSYLGFFLIGMTYMSIGLLFSSLSKNQVVAFSLSMLVMVGLWLLGFEFFRQYIPTESLRSFFQYLSIKTHFDSFARGVLDTRDFIYFFSVTGFALFLSARALASRKWK
jgi:ABC-2 type transport system permease protein